MRLRFSAVLDLFLLASREAARGNARQALDVMARRRREREEVEAFLVLLEPESELAARDLAR